MSNLRKSYLTRQLARQDSLKSDTTVPSEVAAEEIRNRNAQNDEDTQNYQDFTRIIPNQNMIFNSCDNIKIGDVGDSSEYSKGES